jgi:Arc/MetJ-type ribon-helix-helix transcriptional regulator
MSVQIAVRLPEEELRRLDAAIARGAFPSRAAAVRSGLERLLREEREREIAEAYRRAYADRELDPAERLVGEAGLGLGAELLAREDPDVA